MSSHRASYQQRQHHLHGRLYPHPPHPREWHGDSLPHRAGFQTKEPTRVAVTATELALKAIIDLLLKS